MKMLALAVAYLAFGLLSRRAVRVPIRWTVVGVLDALGSWLLWPLLHAVARREAESASEALMARLDHLLGTMAQETGAGGLAALTGPVASLRKRVQDAGKRLIQLEAALRRVEDVRSTNPTRTSSRGALDRLVAVRNRELRSLEELEQLLVVLRAQIATWGHGSSSNEGSRDMVDEVWARVSALEVTFDSNFAPNPSSFDPPSRYTGHD